MHSQWYAAVPMKKQHCTIHPETELRVIVYCPACRGALGGARSGETMTAEEKTKRAKKAARARWKKAKEECVTRVHRSRLPARLQPPLLAALADRHFSGHGSNDS